MIAEYIQPDLIKGGYSSCFITEDISSLFVDRMPYTDQQFYAALIVESGFLGQSSYIHNARGAILS